MEPAILAIHDFAPTVVGPTEPDRAATASAHDDTRSQDHPQLHQQAQNVLPDHQQGRIHVGCAGALAL